MVLAAVLDANVLYPMALTDFFLTLSGGGLYRAHWSGEILREVNRNLLRDHPSITETQLAYRFTEMNRAFPGASVEPPPELTASMTNDEGDRHVLATAVISHASVIVTFDTRHFPPSACRPYGVEAQHPDAFTQHLVGLDAVAVLAAIEEMSERSERPHREVGEIVERLRTDLPGAMDGLTESLEAAGPALLRRAPAR